MPKSKQKAARDSSLIVANKKARFDYFIEESLEAGVVLEGWEVKSLRAGRVQLRDSHVLLKDGEAWLLGSLITPLPSASTHFDPVPDRTRKLLLHQEQIARLTGAVERRGYTLVVLRLYWVRGRVKAEVGLAKGKRQHDKRAAEKERDWQREQQRLLKAY